MYRFLTILLVASVFATGLSAQTDTVRLKAFPNSGYILRSTDHSAFGNKQGPGVDVYTAESKIYTLLPGTVSSRFNIGNDVYVIVKTGDVSVVYSRLQSCLYKKGDVIDKHELLGYVAYSQENSLYKINVQTWRSKEGGAKEDKELLWTLVE